MMVNLRETSERETFKGRARVFRQETKTKKQFQSPQNSLRAVKTANELILQHYPQVFERV